MVDQMHVFMPKIQAAAAIGDESRFRTFLLKESEELREVLVVGHLSAGELNENLLIRFGFDGAQTEIFNHLDVKTTLLAIMKIGRAIAAGEVTDGKKTPVNYKVITVVILTVIEPEVLIGHERS
jgi:hypothetical protein